MLPRKLSINPKHPTFDKASCLRIDKVFCDGRHVAFCAAYNMDEGWAIARLNGYNGPKEYGEITVTEKK